MSKLIFLDVDGTLVDYDGRLPNSAAEAVRRARAAGNLVFLCTGRSMPDIPREMQDIGIDGIIGGSGTFIRDGEEVLFHQPLTEEQTEQIVDWLESRGTEFLLETNNGLFSSSGFEEAVLPVVDTYRNGSEPKEDRGSEPDADMAFPPGITHVGADSLDDGIEVHAPNMQSVRGSQLRRADVNKISFLLSDIRDVNDAMRAFPDLRFAPWGGRGEEFLFAEFSPGGIDKATAIERIVAHRGAKMADTIGIGDGVPDVPMFEACAVSVAMGDAGEEVRQAADIVTDSVDADGLYKAFATLGLFGDEGEENT